MKDKIEAANIYFGAAPVVEALKDKPDIIITGRVTDTGITMAAMIHEFGWQLNDWDKLAHGIVRSHHGMRNPVTGGNFTIKKVDSFDKVGFPIVEVEEDGTFFVTKHDGTGGLVSPDTVREQLFYEMGSPTAYITPDVIADFTSIQLKPEKTGLRFWYSREASRLFIKYRWLMKMASNLKVLSLSLDRMPALRRKNWKYSGIAER